MPSSVPVPFFALTTRGLEDVSAAEIADMPGVTVTGVAYRRVIGCCHAPLAILLRLTTVDDIFIHLARWQAIGRSRATLARIATLSRALDLERATQACSRIHSVGQPPSFCVTASFVGRRNYTTSAIKEALAAGIAHTHGWLYQPDDRHADANIRLFIEHETALVGMRLGKRPLHERPYQIVHRPGALKPPIAAALVRLAAITPGMRVLDPFCGTGTIAIEAARLGASVEASDADLAALAAARTNANANAAGVTLALRHADAGALPLANGTVQRVVSNLPWGRQVSAGEDLAALYQRSLREMERVLAPGGRIVLLTALPSLLPAPVRVRRCARREISLFGQTPTIMVFADGRR